MKLRSQLLIFVPAILIAAFVLFIRVIQYEPLYPSEKDIAALRDTSDIQIPVFPEDPILGSRKAGKTLVVFEDFACPGCAVQMTQLRSLIEAHPKRLKVVWKPLSVIRVPQSSYEAHRYGFCAQKQKKFEEFAARVFDNQNNLTAATLRELAQLEELHMGKLDTCLDSTEPDTYLQNNEVIARALGIQSVPAVFIDNQEVEAPHRLSGWESLLGL